jgi:predicted ArsR family transcriptional regulator
MLGTEGLTQLLTRMTEDRLAQWVPRLEGKSFDERVEALKDVYMEKDAFVHVEKSDGAVRLVEKNCPFMNVASRRPVLCSVTVSVLSRLLGCAVEREKSFQAGHGRCVFLLHTDRPLSPQAPVFAFEKPLPKQ